MQVDFTKGERCVLAHEGVTLRRAAQLAAADGCMAGDEATELYKRRCAVHHQPRAHCLETTTDAQRRFWHAHDNHAGSSSAGEAAARLAKFYVEDGYVRDAPRRRLAITGKGDARKKRRERAERKRQATWAGDPGSLGVDVGPDDIDDLIGPGARGAASPAARTEDDAASELAS